ncbi:MAG: hypothetical protein ACOCZ5_00505 [bacterium]
MKSGKNKGEEKLKPLSYHNSLKSLMEKYAVEKLYNSEEELNSLQKIVDKQQEIYDYIEDKLGDLKI